MDSRHICPKIILKNNKSIFRANVKKHTIRKRKIILFQLDGGLKRPDEKNPDVFTGFKDWHGKCFYYFQAVELRSAPIADFGGPPI